MAGSPIKHERNRLVREAIMKALQKDGQSPEDALVPMAEKFIAQAKEGDVASFREIADRLDGKPSQQVEMTVTRGEPKEMSEDELKRIASSSGAGTSRALGSPAKPTEVH